MPPVQKEQLYPEEHFIRYCDRDEFMGRKLAQPVTEAFLRAAEKDELLMPLLVEKGVRKKEDGSEEEIDIRYYSPFQIFLVVALINNVIDEDGYLCSPDDREFYRKQGTRMVMWGDGGAFSIAHYKDKRAEEPDEMMGNNFALADDFHNLLRLVHGLKPEDRYERMDKRRMMRSLPNLQFDLEPVEIGRATYVEQYGIDLPKLKRTIRSVGYMATHIDPLERWYYYVGRHGQMRKDQLKGLAAVAQDLYGFCDLGYEIVRQAYGEKLPPLLDLLHPDIKPWLMESSGYASGDDIKAIRSASDKLQKWVQDNTELIEEMRPTVEREKLDAVLTQLNADISDYETRYGDRRYVGSTRTIWPETKLKLADLDEQTKKRVESMFKQRMQHEKVDEKEKESILAREITFGIENRMGDLARTIMEIGGRIAEATWPLEHQAKYEKDMAKGPALQEFGKRVSRDDPDYGRKHHEFWTKGLKEYEKPHQEKLDRLDYARKEIRGIANQSRLVFCAVCREKPVKLHHSYNDSQVTSEAICDECLASGKQLTTLGAGEWKCDRCGRMIYKFAHGNVLSDTLRNTSAVTIQLEYGRMEITAKCPNKDCGAEQTRAIDEGWLP